MSSFTRIDSSKLMLTHRVTRRVSDMSDDIINAAQAHPAIIPSDAAYETGRLETEFLAVISHELRSPLAAIKGYAATLRRHGHKLGRAEREEYLEAIEEASDRLEMIIGRLMELARLEAGTLTPDLAPVDVVHLVLEAIAAAEHRWANNLEQYRFIAPEQDHMPLVRADLRLLREVLDIVLENAVKYSPEGGDICVTLAADDTVLTLAVQDSGLGIPAEHLHRIFERFHRVDTRLTREVEGAGLGLAICKRIMRLQGGDIWAESEPGAWSIFYVTLPLARSSDGDTF